VPGRTQRAQCRRHVQRRELGEARQTPLHRVIDEHRRVERLAAVHHTVA
jgi:hypothetical protein